MHLSVFRVTLDAVLDRLFVSMASDPSESPGTAKLTIVPKQ